MGERTWSTCPNRLRMPIWYIEKYPLFITKDIYDNIRSNKQD